MTDTENTKKSPDYNVYFNVQASDNSTKKKQVGVGWKHKSGEGLNIVLDLLPIPQNGKVEMVLFPVNKDLD